MGGHDSLWGIKAGALHDDVKLFFEDARKKDFKGVDHQFVETVNGDHGRIEVRRHWMVSDIEWLEQRGQWKGLKSIAMVESEAP